MTKVCLPKNKHKTFQIYFNHILQEDNHINIVLTTNFLDECKESRRSFFNLL